MPDTEWYKDVVIYELPVKSFFDANNDGYGDFAGLTQKLDYLQYLGVDCIWLLPFYKSPLRDDGYDISDFYTIRPELGTVEDFKHFMIEAHKRGMKVLADLVLNHTSDQHPLFQAARASKDPKVHDYYVWSDDPTRYSGTRIIFTDTEKSNWTWAISRPIWSTNSRAFCMVSTRPSSVRYRFWTLAIAAKTTPITSVLGSD